MHRTLLTQSLQDFAKSSFVTKEELDILERFLLFVTSNTGCFDRSNRGHVTGSAWIVNHDLSQVLLTHHKKLNIWIQLGGHADGDSDIKHVALKEAREESGIEDFNFLIPTIFDIDIHPIPNACDYHYDVRYLLQAPKNTQLIVSEESHDLAWVDITKITDYSSKSSVVRMAEKLQHFMPYQ